MRAGEEPRSNGPSVQAVVDALSIALGRPVLLDDALAPLAYSRQWGVDLVRSESILSRGPSPAVREALLAQSIAGAHDCPRADPLAGARRASRKLSSGHAITATVPAGATLLASLSRCTEAVSTSGWGASKRSRAWTWRAATTACSRIS